MTNTAVEYAVYLCDPFGVRLKTFVQEVNPFYGNVYYSVKYVAAPSARTGDASAFLSLTYARVVNDVGRMTLVLPGAFDASILRIPDGRIEVWRRLPNGREYLDTETIWLIKAVEYTRDDQGNSTITIEADTPLSVIGDPGRVVIPWVLGVNQGEFGAAPADNQIIDLVADAIADPSARIETFDAYIAIAAKQGLGASVSKAFAWRNVLKVAQEFAEASTNQGTYIAFDIVAPTPDTLEFRTYAGQRGVDHRFPGGQNPVILSPDFGNLGETTLRIDYRDTASHVYIGGKGEGVNRVYSAVRDETLIGSSPFGDREVFIELSNTADTTLLQNEGYAELRGRRPRKTFRGRIISTPDTQYGVHWGWGDYVTAQDFGQSFDCRIDAITVTVEDGKETVDAWLRAETTT